MLDIQTIRDDPERVKRGSKAKGYKVDIDKLLELDEERKIAIRRLELLKEIKNLYTAQYKMELEINEIASKLAPFIKEIKND